MNDSQRNTLQRYRRRLADDLILTEEFLAQLIEEGIFEWGMVGIIKAEKTESDQIYKLLDLLPKRGPRAFTRFVVVLERDYPWLATLLVSSANKPSNPPALRDQVHRGSGSSLRPQLVSLEVNANRGTPGDDIDGDILKLVASFVHRQFGQSKRISEKDKKAMERFIKEQLQQERVRYQDMLPRDQHNTSCPSSMSEGLEEVFEATEVQDHLFRIHLKIEPHLNPGQHTTTSSTTTGSDNSKDSSSNNKDNSGIINSSGGIQERILPDDLSFDIIHREMDQLCLKLHRLEEQVHQSMKQFKPEVQQTPLPELVKKMHEELRKQQRELEETEDHNRRLLDEVHRYSDHIEKLEKERREYRTRVNVLNQDMAKVRQEKMALQERYRDLERSHKERMQKESTLDNLRLLVKDLRTHPTLTPRNHGPTARSHMLEEGAGVVGRGVQGRRSARTSQAKQGMAYPLYARRYAPGTRGVTKKGKNNSASTTTTK